MHISGLKARFEEAVKISRDASAFLLTHESLRRDIGSKAENDYVTEADKECERLILSRIVQAFPSDAILSEESGGTDHGCRWIVDPIDGTVNFMSSFPDYTISIAFQDEEGIAFGVVTVPRQGEEFTALRGEGAYLNGERIHVDEKIPLSQSLALLVPPHRHKEYLKTYMEGMERFYHIISDVRSIGSAALSLCYVASGRCSMYYEMALHIYDCAAGMIILEEAGGKFTFLTPGDDSWIDIAASRASSHCLMLETINA